jgi:RecB family exonuclease
LIPKTISPSSLITFEGCPARFHAENILAREADLSFHTNEPAKFGTACHAALDEFIKNGHHQDPKAKFTTLQAYFVKAYYELFSDPDWYDLGIKLLENWWNRRRFGDRTVVSTEEKKFFLVPVILPDGTKSNLQFNYICDRVDHLDNGEIEITDYKTIIRPVSPEELRHKIQARAYALAAQIDYPRVERIWVTFDLLRYQPVSVPFSRADNIETWTYLKNVAQRIINSDGTEEVINDGCRFCVRKEHCNSLLNFTKIAGPQLDVENLDEVLKYRYQLKSVMDAAKQMIGQADEVIGTFLDENDLMEAESEYFTVRLRTRGERRVDSDFAARIIGDELTAKYGRIGIKELELLMDDPKVDDEMRSQLKQLIRKDVTSSWIEAKPRKEAELEDL